MLDDLLCRSYPFPGSIGMTAFNHASLFCASWCSSYQFALWAFLEFAFLPPSSLLLPLQHSCRLFSSHVHLYINLRRSRDVVVRGGRRSDVRAYGRTYAVRGDRPDSFSSLWADFTLTVHMNALYNESIHGKEEHAT